MKKSLTLVAIFALTAFTGCKKDEPKPEATAAAAAPQAEIPKAKPSELAPDEPSSVDAISSAEMEDEAEEKIGPDQLESELDRLEAEIAIQM
jgi:hypothetical protein